MTDTTRKDWYVEHYSPIAWLETAIKLVALGIAIFTLIDHVPSAKFETPEGLALAQVIILAILSLGLVAAIYDRIIEREIIAMGFVIINNIGHWGMVAALMTIPRPDTALLAFAGFMLVGDSVKFYWLVKTKFRVRDVPLSVMVGLTLFFVFGYALILLLELIW